MAKNETSNDALQNAKSILEESSSKIPDVAIYTTQRIGKVYANKTSGVKFKSIIVWFTTFQHRTIFYHSRTNLKRNVKLKLDLTKKRYSIITEVIQLVKNNKVVKFVMADINCHLKVVFKDGYSPF